MSISISILFIAFYVFYYLNNIFIKLGYEKKIVYVGLSADILHKGHINILKTAAKLGRVTVGLLTDEAGASYKNQIPYLNFEQRQIILQNIKFVDKVIPQNALDYVKNLRIIKPDYVVHGDDWKKGCSKKNTCSCNQCS